MDGGEGTTKYAKGAKRQTKLLFKDESYRQSTILKQRANSQVYGLTLAITRNPNTSGLSIKHFRVFCAFRS